MVCYQFSKLHVAITIIMHLDNHDYRNHDDLIIVTKNNHDNLFQYLTIIAQHYQQKNSSHYSSQPARILCQSWM